MKALGIAIVAGTAVVVLVERLINWFSRIHANKSVEKILNNPTNADPRVLENPENGTLLANGTGFKIVTRNRDVAELFWDGVEEIHAFKKDLITTDLICLAFKRSGKEGYYEIDEEMAGYYDLLQEMQNHLPGFNLNWVPDTASPAFATNHRVIWRKSQRD